MTKEDLEFGNVVELKNGWLCLIEPRYNYGFGDTIKQYLKENYTIQLRDIKTAEYSADLNDYTDDLTCDDLDGNDELSIMKVYKDYTLKELLWERKE